ncbi:ABC transporter [Kosmotoga arenicorallina S304]|uniref:ABC transporter n=1 Tax=Kosmotoga arenicorallina S304 TaxID=1453497 RepID=A0A176JZD9_9BACT|nr:ABC transporter ATP-binding protein [Kosmotoga arenicorallina]OAA29438.1 ABC transporter [Kosmotoga arenicorallina S304]
MPEIVLKHITKRFGKVYAVKDFDLVVEDRDFVTLLGPSGCGKTTTLRMISGLETPTDGEIEIDGKVVFSSEKQINLSPDKRDVGLLFQNYALWPHMTVYQNIAFGLENLKWKKPDIKKRVYEMAELVKITDLLERYPAELSGGQQQRVAIARTLAPNPRVLLMDEPLSNLDAKLRMEMRSELKRLHKEIEATFVYVTHDQYEAMTLATKICLMKEGVLQQYAPPLEIYDNPKNIFVGDFIGNPSMNFIESRVVDVNGKGYVLKGENLEFNFTPKNNLDNLSIGQEVIVGIRPEDIKISADSANRCVVYSTLPSGMETIIKANLKGIPLTIVTFGRVDFEIDEEIGVDFDSYNYNVFSKSSGEKLAIGGLNLLG